jgi:squalene-associated FAD-dependent desaturase
MKPRGDLVVIGGGFAGLSAGVALARSGFRVAVLESKPALGGRAYSFADADTGDFVDNGQHVLMGCYTGTLDFLREIGSYDKLVFRENLEIEMIDQRGAHAWLRTANLPGPFHMTGAALGYRHLTAIDRLRLLTAGARLLAMRRFARARLERTTVSGLMDLLGQSQRARDCFWYPLSIATLNDDPAVSSAALLAEVLKRGFFSGRRDSAFVYSRVGLSDLYCAAAKSYLESRGGSVSTRAPVDRFELDSSGRILRARVRDGRAVAASAFIAAVPPQALLKMLPEAIAAQANYARLLRLDTSPIICVHLWLDREVIDAAFVGFIGTATQWLFNKRKIFADRGESHPGYLSFVISGARSLVDRPNQELLAQVLADLRKMIPAAREAKVVKALVLKEKQATMAPSLDSHLLRPGVVTSIPNLFVAGDWIQTGLPATIESAVISGLMAAAEILARADQFEAIKVSPANDYVWRDLLRSTHG